MKNKLCGIGEALIDFIPEVKGQRLKDVPSFKRVAGGAPANVVGAVTKLGIPSKFLTKLGDCLLYTSPSPRDTERSRMPSSA